MQPSLRREMAAEFIGTFMLLVFGCGSVAQVVLSHQNAGNFLTIHLAWGLAVMLAVYLVGSISGAHLNPAITLALAVRHRFPWKKTVPFITAQFLGAFVASMVVYITYHEAIAAFDGGVRHVTGDLATAGIWATYPQNFLSTFPGGLIDQMVGTGLLTLVVFALADKGNTLISPWFTPVIVGCSVMLIGMTFGFNSGYAINPARDLAPRLFSALAGWGPEVFRAGNYWWWVPVVGPILGAVLAGCLYDFLFTRATESKPLTSAA